MNSTSEINKHEWKIISTHPDQYEDLIDNLSGIIDPELGYSVLQLGLIRDIEFIEDHILVTMILTTPFCPYGPAMMESVRKKVEVVLNIHTEIVYGTEVWIPSMMEDGLMDEDWGLVG